MFTQLGSSLHIIAIYTTKLLVCRADVTPRHVYTVGFEFIIIVVLYYVYNKITGVRG